MSWLLLAALDGGGFEPSRVTTDPWLRTWLLRWPIALGPALFTWLLPALLRYRRGQMAKIGAALSLALTIVLALSMISPAIFEGYFHFRHVLYAIFYLYAASGIALCYVGIV